MRAEPASPVELPVLGARRERRDAAANRGRILDAARAILARDGAEGLTMAAVAEAAGVGKGTLFRRFGDRAGLTEALLDEFARDFQDAFLLGPPPLGPGAPPAERLEAFVVELVRGQIEHLEPSLAAEAPPGTPPSLAHGTLLIHAAALIAQIDPDANAEVLAGMLLSALAPSLLRRMQTRLGADAATLEAAALRLVRGLAVAPPPAQS